MHNENTIHILPILPEDSPAMQALKDNAASSIIFASSSRDPAANIMTLAEQTLSMDWMIAKQPGQGLSISSFFCCSAKREQRSDQMSRMGAIWNNAPKMTGSQAWNGVRMLNRKCGGSEFRSVQDDMKVILRVLEPVLRLQIQDLQLDSMKAPSIADSHSVKSQNSFISTFCIVIAVYASRLIQPYCSSHTSMTIWAWAKATYRSLDVMSQIATSFCLSNSGHLHTALRLYSRLNY